MGLESLLDAISCTLCSGPYYPAYNQHEEQERQEAALLNTGFHLKWVSDLSVMDHSDPRIGVRCLDEGNKFLGDTIEV